MDTTDHEITFDSEGICSHCAYVEKQLKFYWHPNATGARMLRDLIAKVKKEGAGKPYDSIIGLSGGVDSSYLATKVVEWGLRPLAVHVDGGWNSELAIRNIELIVTKCNLDLVTYVVDWEEMRNLQVAFLRSHVANQDSPQDHAFFAALYNYAVKNKIRYVISGSNYATESILPVSWGYDPMDIRHLKDIAKQFGPVKLSKFPLVSTFNYHFGFPRVRGMTVIRPLNYISYNKSLAIRHLESSIGWRYYGGKHYESRWTRFFQAHYLPRKFGYDKRKAHLASLIVSGDISRDEAISELERPLYTDNELADDKAFVAKKLNLKVSELDELIDAPGRHYTQYRTNEQLVRFITAIDRFGATIRRRLSS